MKHPKLMVIGLDAVSLSLLDSFKDHTPTIRRQRRSGVCGHALPSFPIYTPTNWAVIATGADSSATGAVDWNRTIDGEAISTFDSRAVAADSIFAAAARGGLKTLAITYPGAFPPPTRNNMALCPLDRGLVSNCLVPGKVVDVKPGRDGAFEFVLLEAPKAASGAVLAKAVGATEDGADLGGKKRKVSARAIPARLLKTGKAAWKLHVGRAALSLHHEKWSEPIPVRITMPGRPGQCVVRGMVFDNGKRLAVSEAYDIGNLGAPNTLARDVYRTLGPPTEHSPLSTHLQHLIRRGIHDNTLFRLTEADLDRQAKWIADAAAETLKRKPYDVFYLHHHLPDNYMHAYLAMAEGSPDYSAKQHRLARRAIGLMFRVCDRLIARLLKLAGPKTTVLLVSDHGDVPNRYAANLSQRLRETGLMVENRSGNICKRRSIAWPHGMGIKLNVAGRPGSVRYQANQARVIDALLDWKTPGGERVIAVALRAKDGHLLGYDDREGADVLFHYNSGFYWGPTPKGKSVVENRTGANHGPQMPVTFSKLSDNMAFFVLTGPRVRRGLRWDFHTAGHIKLMDMVPTICHASGVPAPRDVDGAVRYRLLT